MLHTRRGGSRGTGLNFSFLAVGGHSHYAPTFRHYQAELEEEEEEERV